MSNDSKSTGITLPWEKDAINGNEMPKGLEYPDQILFLCLRMLYAQKKSGIIDRETAVGEKKRLLDEYRLYQFRNEMEKEWVQMVKETEMLRAEYRKNPTVENGMKLISAIEGGKNCKLS